MAGPAPPGVARHRRQYRHDDALRRHGRPDPDSLPAGTGNRTLVRIPTQAANRRSPLGADGIGSLQPPPFRTGGAGSRELGAGSWKLETGNWKLGISWPLNANESSRETVRA